MQGTSQGDLVEALGGTGVTIPFAEVVPALQRGTVDCGITGTMPAYKAGWHEVTSHVLNLPVGFSVSFTIASLATWNKLDDKTKAFIDGAIKGQTDKWWKTIIDEDTMGLNCTTGTGECSVGKPGKLIKVEPTAADSAILETAMKDVVLKRWAKRCGADASLHQQLERHRRQSGRPDGRAVILPNRAGWSARDFIRPVHWQAAFRGALDADTVEVVRLGIASMRHRRPAGPCWPSRLPPCFEILGRKYFNFSFRGLDEIGGYMLAGVSAFGFAYALSKHSHMRVTLLFPYIPASVQSVLNVLAMVTLAAMAAFCAWRGGFEVLEHADDRASAPTRRCPSSSGSRRSIWFAGMVLFAVGAVVMALHSLALLVGDRARLNRLYGPQSLEEEISSEIAHAEAGATPRRRAGHDRHRLRHHRLRHPAGGDDARPAHRHRDVRRRLHRRRALPRLARRQRAWWSSISARWTKSVLLQLPLFILLGEILVRCGATDRMYRSLADWLNPLPGGLLHTNVAASALFSAVSGSSVATAATISTVALPAFKKKNYDTRMVLGSIAAGGSLGNLIPPGIALIIYGVLTNTSVARLYAGGVFPGLALTLMFMGVIVLLALLAALDRAA